MRTLIPYAGAERVREVERVKKPRQPGTRRGERVDLRLTAEEKAKLNAKAKATRRTVSSILTQLIEEMDKIIP